jgi:hypothetical protein
MERQDFEDSWKKAFDKAEIPPSDNAWTNVELDLERANGSKLKKRLVVFQLLAAASVVFALGLGAGVFIMKNSYENAAEQLATKQMVKENSKETAPSQLQDKVTSTQENVNQQSITSLNRTDGKTSTQNLKRNSGVTTSRTSGAPRSGDITTVTLDQNNVSEADVFSGSREESSLNLASNETLPSIIEQTQVELVLPEEKKETVDPVQMMLAKLDQREREMRDAEEAKKEKAQRSEKLWTSVGFAAGSFSASNAGVSDRQAAPSALSQNSSITNSEAKASGTSYSIGANIGTRLSERWVFQGGVNYLTQSSDYTAHSAVIASADHTSFRPASINELNKINESDVPAEEKLVATAPYNVNNNLRYLSIPMQAGYMVINKNFGLQLNAGVSTDLFLQNTVSADGGNLDKTTQDRGESSPYRSVNLSGLAGTELSYRFSKNYRVALNPGIRYPFNSIYRSELAVKSTPITFDIGLRFRYIFH